MTKKESTEPVLVYENGLEYNVDIHKIDIWLRPYFPKIEKAFAGLGIGPLTDEYLADILYNDLAKIKRTLANEAREETPSRFLASEVARKAHSLVSVLQDVCGQLDETVVHVGLQSLLEYLSIDGNGCIVVTDDAKAELLETYRKYATTPKGIKGYQLHQAAAKAINEFKENVDIGFEDVLELFRLEDDGTIIAVPMDYE